MITLDRDNWRLEMLPLIGGGVKTLSWKDRAVLRPAPVFATGARQTGCFPLVPFTNRIARGRFTFEDREVALPLRDPRNPDNALHGDGWVAAWRIAAQTQREIALVYDHPEAEAWPWPYQARQTVTLNGEQAIFDLEVRNTGREAMPAGLGFHPYFPCDPASRLQARTDGVWLTDEAFIPTEQVKAGRLMDWSQGPTLRAAPAIDHCYVGWDGCAVLTSGDLMTTITASETGRYLQIFAPQGGDFCCIEPVTHVPAALNHPDTFARSGMVRLQPGETLALQMTLKPALLL